MLCLSKSDTIDILIKRFMNNLLRTFIAVKITPQPGLVRLVNEFRQELRGEAVKWVDLQNMHLTVKFIGDTTPEQVDQIKSVLGDIAYRFPVFSFSLDGVGFFQRGGQPSVLFIKTDTAEILNKLASGIDDQLQLIGFEKESRRFSPHLTLGRIKYLKEKSSFLRLTEKFGQYPVQEVVCRQVIFYQSVLMPQGPLYKPLAEIKLQGDNSDS